MYLYNFRVIIHYVSGEIHETASVKIRGKDLGLDLRTIPPNHNCFGPELGFGLGSDGLLPDNKPILRFVILVVACMASVIGVAAGIAL